MKKLLLLLIFLNISLYGVTSVEEIEFESGVSLYGKIGTTTLTYEEDLINKTYKIKVQAKSSGILKVLFNNRVDTFISKGKIENGIYKPLQYIKMEVDNNSDKTLTYNFDYENGTVLKTTIKHAIDIKTTFDHMQMKIVKKEVPVTKKSSKNIAIAQNDFLSLYLNLIHDNLQFGQTKALDQKEQDSISLISKNTLSINNNDKESIYKITLEEDDKSIFFKKAITEIAFYGHAYMKKISQRSEVIN